jgi:hypothetical protein
MPSTTPTSQTSIFFFSTFPAFHRGSRTLRLLALPALLTPHRGSSSNTSWPCEALCGSRGQRGNAGAGAQGGKAHILVVGDGINGPVFALAVRQKGFEVLVLEWDMSAICGEGMYNSPI